MRCFCLQLKLETLICLGYGILAGFIEHFGYFKKQWVNT